MDQCGVPLVYDVKVLKPVGAADFEILGGTSVTFNCGTEHKPNGISELALLAVLCDRLSGANQIGTARRDLARGHVIKAMDCLRGA